MRTLVDIRTRNLIGDAEFAEKRGQLQAELFRLREEGGTGGRDSSARMLELTNCVALFRKYAADWFLCAAAAKKKMILQTVGSNCILGDAKLSIQANIPFETVLNEAGFLTWSAKLEHIGTDPAWKVRTERIVSVVRFLEASAWARLQGTAPPPSPWPAKQRRPRTSSVRDVRRRGLRLAEDRDHVPQDESA